MEKPMGFRRHQRTGFRLQSWCHVERKGQEAARLGSSSAMTPTPFCKILLGTRWGQSHKVKPRTTPEKCKTRSDVRDEQIVRMTQQECGHFLITLLSESNW